MDFYLSEMRVLRNYEGELKKLGLRRLVSIVTGLKHRCYRLEQELVRRKNEWKSVDFLVEDVHWRLLVRVFRGRGVCTSLPATPYLVVG